MIFKQFHKDIKLTDEHKFVNTLIKSSISEFPEKKERFS